MLNTKDRIVKVLRQLLPTGRAWRSIVGSNIYKLFNALAKSIARCYDAAKSILNSLLPDNDGFTEDDATDWERRLGLITNPSVSLSDRNKAISRKMAGPARNPARSHYLFLQKQLQDAGFNVWVHENIVPNYPSGYLRVAPGIYNNGILTQLEHGAFENGMETGSYFNYIIANSIFNEEDIALFNSITDFGASFFIGGSVFGTYANVPSTREKEFRQLVLGQKQTQNIAFGFINFI